MISFKTTILRFERKAEKTGWTYIEVPADIVQQLLPGNKKPFRVKGKLDTYTFKQVALLPMGGGAFIMPLNAAMRKGLGKRAGATVMVKIDVDTSSIPLSADMMECLEDEPRALSFFNTLPMSHQRYFSSWIESAKTASTKTKRIALAVSALAKGEGFGEMMRSAKEAKQREGLP